MMRMNRLVLSLAVTLVFGCVTPVTLRSTPSILGGVVGTPIETESDRLLKETLAKTLIMREQRLGVLDASRAHVNIKGGDALASADAEKTWALADVFAANADEKLSVYSGGSNNGWGLNRSWGIYSRRIHPGR